jgi:hypothetical protein
MNKSIKVCGNLICIFAPFLAASVKYNKRFNMLGFFSLQIQFHHFNRKRIKGDCMTWRKPVI